MADIPETQQRDLQDALEQVRRRAHVLLHWHGIFVAAALVIGVLVGGLLLAHYFPQLGRFRHAFWAGLSVLGAAGYYLAGIRPRQRYRTDEQVARLIQRELPEVGDAPVNAVQFQCELDGSTNFSPALLRAYLRRARTRLRGISSRVSVSEIPVLRSLGIAMVVGALSLGSVIFGGQALFTGLRNLTHGPAPTESGEAISQMELRDLEVKYFYPEYLDRPPRVVRGDDGNLEAVKGTSVRLSGTLAPIPESAHMIINEADGRPVAVDSDGSFRVEFPLLEKGSYRIVSREQDGAKTASRSIRLVRDKEPQVRISALAPQPGEGDVLRLEPGSSLQIAYRCRDDFGLGKVFVEYSAGGRRSRETVHTPENGQSTDSGVYEWILPRQGPPDTGDLTLRIGARDNDNISGPKTGYSRPITIRPITEEMRHKRVLEHQEELKRHMVELLAVELMAPFGRASRRDGDSPVSAAHRLVGTLQSVVDRTSSVLTLMETDALADKTFQTELEEMLTRRKSELGQFTNAMPDGQDPEDQERWRALAKRVEAAIPSLEDDILKLDDLLQMDHMRSVRRMAERLQNMQKRLQELLEKARNQKLSDKELAQLRDQIAAMKRLMNRMNQQLARTARQIEREFMNPDALQKAGANQQLAKSLDELQKMAESGRLEDALSEAQSLNQRINQMMSALGQSGKRLARARLGPGMEKMQKLQQGLQEVRKQQARLHQETRELRDGLHESARKQHQETLNDAFEKNLERAWSVEKRLKELNSTLSQRTDIDKYNELRGQLRKTLEQLSSADDAGLEAKKDGHSAEAARERLDKLYSELSRMQGASAAGAVKEDVPRGANQVSKLKDELNQRQLDASLQQAKSLVTRLQKWQRNLRRGGRAGAGAETTDQAAETSERIRSSLAELSKRIQDSMRKKARGAKGQPAGKAGEEQGKTAEQLSRLMQEFGKSAGHEMQQILKDARSQMESAAGRLSQRQLDPATDHQSRALDRLDRAIGKSRQAMQQMQQNMQGRTVRAGGQRRPSDGRYGHGTERVRIPDPSSYRVPAEFREAIEEALRDGMPRSYKESNEEYYKELVK